MRMISEYGWCVPRINCECPGTDLRLVPRILETRPVGLKTVQDACATRLDLSPGPSQRCSREHTTPYSEINQFDKTRVDNPDGKVSFVKNSQNR